MKILAILAHPSKTSFNASLMKSYIKGAKQNNQVKSIILSDLKFDPILHEGYRVKQPLEPDLKKAQKLISWADKITIFYPTWWGAYPSLLKAFFERTILPGFAFRFKSPYVRDKLLKGKSARIVVTMDSPYIYHWLTTRDPGYGLIKATLCFCGVCPVKKTYFSRLKFKNKDQRKNILEKIYKIGLKE